MEKKQKIILTLSIFGSFLLGILLAYPSVLFTNAILSNQTSSQAEPVYKNIEYKNRNEIIQTYDETKYFLPFSVEDILSPTYALNDPIYIVNFETTKNRVQKILFSSEYVSHLNDGNIRPSLKMEFFSSMNGDNKFTNKECKYITEDVSSKRNYYLPCYYGIAMKLQLDFSSFPENIVSQLKEEGDKISLLLLNKFQELSN